MTWYHHNSLCKNNENRTNIGPYNEQKLAPQNYILFLQKTRIKMHCLTNTVQLKPTWRTTLTSTETKGAHSDNKEH